MKPTNRLRELRKKAGLTQSELAEMAGVSQPSISQVENDTRPLDVDDMRAFARILRCNPADLLDDRDNPDRLSDEERELLRNFRSANPAQRALVQRVAEPLHIHHAETSEEDPGKRINRRRAA